MAIIVSDNFSLNSRQFLDARIGKAKTLDDLRTWNEDELNLPNGFEVWVDDVRKWYIFDKRNTLGSTGYFRERVGNSKENFTTNLDDITTPEFWGLTIDTPEEQRKEVLYQGKNVSVIDEEYGTNIYILNNEERPYTLSSWNQVAFDNFGLMVMTQSRYDSLAQKPSEWIQIPDDDEGMYVESTETVVTQPGTNIDIIFRALRALQAEVTKLRNSFKYGMYSYTDENTAMSTQMFELGNGTEEPLWAVDESGLEGITDCTVTISQTPNLSPLDLIRFDEHDKSLSIAGSENNTVKWSYDDGIMIPAASTLQQIDDSKIFAYFISSNENIKLTLTDHDDESLEELVIKFSDYSAATATLESYACMICISRKKEGLGYNFIWISITNAQTNETAVEGYYDKNNGGRIVDELVELDTAYTIRQIEFWDTSIKKVNLYSKYQDFSKNIIPTQASDTNYKYEVAHITIRSVETYSVLEKIKDQLPENELIYVKGLRQLWIKSGNSLISLSNYNKDDGMTEEEVIKLLKDKYGIIRVSENGDEIEINDVADITFINHDNNKKYLYKPNSNGELVGLELPKKTLAEKVSEINAYTQDGIEIREQDSHKYYRGFCTLVNLGEKNINESGTQTANDSSDLKLNSDRVKIGQFYAPLSTDNIYGCSHAFVELENTSDKDFQLDGCYLHYFYQISNDDTTIHVHHLPLSGKIPKGSTYLIRGKQYSDPKTCKNTFINVETYDKEWWISESPSGGEKVYDLIDFTINMDITDPLYGFLLTYGKSGITITNGGTVGFVEGDVKTSVSYSDYFIDSIAIGKNNTLQLSGPVKTANTGVFQSLGNGNCIFRNTFELDPAKQAYQSLYVQAGKTSDSSRVRWANANDIQYLNLNKEYITFPNTSDIKCPVSSFTPKASFEGKNVCTDKTQLDQDKPNAVTCAFGSTSNTIRCFNWVSAGKFDEYLWVREEGTNTWSAPIESYKIDDSGKYSGDTNFERVTIEQDELEAIYNRITNKFPGNDMLYTSHKLMVSINTTVNSLKAYEYIVGRKLENGLPDPEHTSEVQYFHLYPNTWTPRVFQTTDQQGFHWIEYQVWSAAAKKINEEINNQIYTTVASPQLSNISTYFEKDENGHYKYTKDTTITTGKTYYTHNELVPVLVNTGDMTQNGTRANEWLDYFIGAKPLINHLEHMCIVGNNDLCGNDVTILGTGDDPGKANGYFFHVFYCYQSFNLTITGVTEGECEAYEPNYDPTNQTISNIKPIVNSKYIPSLYYFVIGNFAFIMINSEITFVNCQGWFKTTQGDKVFNIYNGWEVKQKEAILENQSFINSTSGGNFTTIYTMLYAMLKELKNKHVVCMCHEMPFTVITKACMDAVGDAQPKRFRSQSDAGTPALIGSHMNQLTALDTGRGIYWFSRLLEYNNVTLVIGGHKHTFACTWPLAENYHEEGSVNGVSAATLCNDNIIWEEDSYSINQSVSKKANLTKFPKALCPSGYTNGANDFIDPIKSENSLNGKVTYFMCQATGFKLKSNKELPGNQQLFSRLLPQTQASGDKPANSQQFPMFGILEFNTTSSNNTESASTNIYLCRIENIMTKFGVFTQSSYEKNNDMVLSYAQSYYANMSDNQIYTNTDGTTNRYPISSDTQESDESKRWVWPYEKMYFVNVKLNTITT